MFILYLPSFFYLFFFFFFLMIRRPPRSALFPYNDALPIWSMVHRGSRINQRHLSGSREGIRAHPRPPRRADPDRPPDRKSTRLNSSHSQNSYAVFCLKKKKKKKKQKKKKKKKNNTTIK